MSNDLKAEVIEILKSKISHKLTELKNDLKNLQEAAEADTKSSAGDKHETARAMVQIEQEKIASQLKATNEQLVFINSFNPQSFNTIITKGSLVITDKQNLFIGLGLGKLVCSAKEVIDVSINSPISQLLMGKACGDKIIINGNQLQIKSIL
jgi:transcription elongation GreA/GreB family factor